MHQPIRMAHHQLHKHTDSRFPYPGCFIFQTRDGGAGNLESVFGEFRRGGREGESAARIKKEAASLS